MKKSIKDYTIKIAEKIAPIVSSRDIIVKLKNSISKLKAKKVSLDFSNVVFVSRSAAHELLIMKEELERKMVRKKSIIFINTNNDVKEMIRTVASNRAIPERNKPKFRAEVVNIDTIIKNG